MKNFFFSEIPKKSTIIDNVYIASYLKIKIALDIAMYKNCTKLPIILHLMQQTLKFIFGCLAKVFILMFYFPKLTTVN